MTEPCHSALIARPELHARAGCSPVLQGQAQAEAAINAADNLSLPFQYGPIAPQYMTDTRGAQGEDDRADKAQHDEDDPQQGQLQRR